MNKFKARGSLWLHDGEGCSLGVPVPLNLSEMKSNPSWMSLGAVVMLSKLCAGQKYSTGRAIMHGRPAT
jgi:hypothetical protein